VTPSWTLPFDFNPESDQIPDIQQGTKIGFGDIRHHLSAAVYNGPGVGLSVPDPAGPTEQLHSNNPEALPRRERQKLGLEDGDVERGAMTGFVNSLNRHRIAGAVGYRWHPPTSEGKRSVNVRIVGQGGRPIEVGRTPQNDFSYQPIFGIQADLCIKGGSDDWKFATIISNRLILSSDEDYSTPDRRVLVDSNSSDDFECTIRFEREWPVGLSCGQLCSPTELLELVKAPKKAEQLPDLDYVWVWLDHYSWRSPISLKVAGVNQLKASDQGWACALGNSIQPPRVKRTSLDEFELELSCQCGC